MIYIFVFTEIQEFNIIQGWQIKSPGDHVMDLGRFLQQALSNFGLDKEKSRWVLLKYYKLILIDKLIKIQKGKIKVNQ